MDDRNIAFEKEDFIYGNMEVHNLRIHQGRALQAPEMPPVPGQGEVREGVTTFDLLVDSVVDGITNGIRLVRSSAFIRCSTWSPLRTGRFMSRRMKSGA